MKIAVIGAGAIGSVVAGLLSKQGEDVLLVGKAAQVDAIRRNGLLIRRADGQETVQVKVAERLDQVYDLVIFTVKTQDIEDAYQENHSFLNEKTLIFTTQNGVQADNLLSIHFEREQVTSSIVMFGATYTKPGEVTFNFPGDWIIGKPYSTNDRRVWEIEAILKKSFTVVVTDQIMGMKWLKLFVNFNNCIPALTGKSMQETFPDLDLCKLSIMLLREGLNIVQRSGLQLVSLPHFPVDRIEGLTKMPIDQAAGIINKTLPGLSKEPLYGSILQSIMRGRTSEIDFINGEVAMMALSIHLDAPLNRKIVAMVHEVERSGRFFTSEEIKREFNLNAGAQEAHAPAQ